MRKMFTFLLMMMLVLNCIIVKSDSVVDDKQVLAEQIFGKEGFNIVINTDDKDCLTRSEMARIMYNISDGGKYALGSFEDNPYLEQFKDVDETHWAYDYIDTMRLAGVFNGGGYGNFNPDKPCKYIDFLKASIFITGYSTYYGATGFGDTYYEKCCKCANEMNINIVDLKNDDYITVEEVYLFLFDMLFVPQVRDVGYTYPYSVYDFSYNLLKLNYGIEMDLGYFKKIDENSYLLQDGEFVFKGDICNDDKFEDGYVICFYTTNSQIKENDIVLCVSISEKLYQNCFEKYDKYKNESENYNKYFSNDK